MGKKCGKFGCVSPCQSKSCSGLRAIQWLYEFRNIHNKYIRRKKNYVLTTKSIMIRANTKKKYFDIKNFQEHPLPSCGFFFSHFFWSRFTSEWKAINLNCAIFFSSSFHSHYILCNEHIMPAAVYSHHKTSSLQVSDSTACRASSFSCWCHDNIHLVFEYSRVWPKWKFNFTFDKLHKHHNIFFFPPKYSLCFSKRKIQHNESHRQNKS